MVCGTPVLAQCHQRLLAHFTGLLIRGCHLHGHTCVKALELGLSTRSHASLRDRQYRGALHPGNKVLQEHDLKEVNFLIPILCSSLQGDADGMHAIVFF